MVLMMVVGDVLAMSSSTDNVRPSPLPNRWRIGRLTVAGIAMGAADLVFCIVCLMVGKAGLAAGQMQTLAVVTLVFSGQAVFYISRERQHLWSSRPGIWLLISSVVDIGLICVLAGRGYLMPALPLGLLAGVLLAASAFVLDTIKLAAFQRLGIA